MAGRGGKWKEVGNGRNWQICSRSAVPHQMKFECGNGRELVEN